MLPRAKNAFLALPIFSWTAREADRLYCHQTPKHLAVAVVEISTPAMSNFSGSLCVVVISLEPPAWMHSALGWHFSEIANNTCLLAHSIFRCSSPGSQVVSKDSSTCIGLAHENTVFLLSQLL